MIFEQEYVIFELLDVVYLDQENVNMYNSKRNFDAISFRYEADTIMKNGDKTTVLSDNSICYVPSNVDYTRISKKDKMIVVHFKCFNYHSNEIEHFTPNVPERYIESFKAILRCWKNKDISYKSECASIVNRIFADMYRENTPVLRNRKISESILYLEKNCLRKDFSLTEAASKSFVSETYFRKLFKEEFNISPKRYVIERRIEYAKALIIAGYFSVREVADMCGYNDDKHFAVEFKKITGVSPSRFKYNYAD